MSADRVRNEPNAAPLILTTELRREHFPPERNYLEAHVTLFHALPAMVEAELGELLVQLTKATAPVAARLEGIMNLGRGTALKLSSPSMLDLRAAIADRFHGMLTAQDSHVPRLHVTIQNKVVPEKARALQAMLAGSIVPRDFTFPGLALFRYRGGPWEAVRRFAFRGRA